MKKPRVPRPLYNPIALAKAGARKLTPDQLAHLNAPSAAAAKALQFGHFDDNHWRNLADAFHIAEALAQPPVNIANDHIDKFEEAQTVLYALSEQYRERGTWTAKGVQLAVVQDALEIFGIQLENVAQGEFERAVEKLKRRMTEALRGNGGKVQLVEALS